MDKFPIFIKNQVVASTLKDSHGEAFTKEFFEKLLSTIKGKYPLGDSHEIGLEPLGYMENFRIIPIEDSVDHWNVIADIHLSEDANIDDYRKGFSWSSTEISLAVDNHKGCIYLPYPYYNDETFIRTIYSNELGISVGKWYKKSVDPGEIALIVSLLNLVLSPAWKRVYDQYVHPFIISAIQRLITNTSIELHYDFAQVIETHDGNITYVYFKPRHEENYHDLQPNLIKNGLEEVESFIHGREAMIRLITLQYYTQTMKYEIIRVTYLDGTTEIIRKN